MIKRKELKHRAKQSLKKHFTVWVLVCIVAMLLSGESLFYNYFADDNDEISTSVYIKDPSEEDNDDNTEYVESLEELQNATGTSSNISDRFTDILIQYATKGADASKAQVDKNIQESIDSSKKNAVLGRSRGVLSSVINRVSSGSFVLILATGINSIIGSPTITSMILILLSIVLMFFFWFLFQNIYAVFQARMFLEGHNYEKVHLNRALYVFKSGHWLHICKTMFVEHLYLMLWRLTIIGGIIKKYSYFLVPYIVAENPSVPTETAIKLSRDMMDGHKWECFKLDISFIGWELLNTFTFGILKILFVRPYQEATFCEYYTVLREIGITKGIDHIGWLDDVYLYHQPNIAPPRESYAAVCMSSYTGEEATHSSATAVPSYDICDIYHLTGIQRFLMKNFGITLKNYDNDIVASQPHAFRTYSIWSMILIFFSMSFTGWLWEVSLHLIEDGEFVNRGVLHGPWLPIYGTGGVLILILLYRLRSNPLKEFIATIIVCGIVEYFTAYYLELTKGGTKWWDYTGYFLNLHGRICAEGLLVFGLGGLGIVYFLAPALDNIFRKIKFGLLLIICLILIGCYTSDQVYSSKHPNVGKGITDYARLENACSYNKYTKQGDLII